MSQFQSLFVKCQECMQRPATIKCYQHNSVTRLCYSCDQAASRLATQPRKTEIIPYQEMYVKTNQPTAAGKREIQQSESQKQFNSAGKNSRIEDNHNVYQSQNNFRQDECKTNSISQELYPSRTKIDNNSYKASATNDSLTSSQFQSIIGKKSPTVVNKASIPQPKLSNSQAFSNNQPQNRQEVLKEESPKRNYQFDFKSRPSEAKAESKPEPKQEVKQEVNKQTVNDLKQAKNQIEQELAKRQKQTDERVKSLQQKLKDVQKQTDDLKKQSTQLGKEYSGLQQQLKKQEKQIQDALEKQQQQYQEKFEELSEQLNQKQQELDEIQGEMQNYNFEAIQASLEMMGNEMQQKDELIAQLQDQLEGQEGQDQYTDGFVDDDVLNQLNSQIENKDTELKKLEELIENFKNLYQHMNDEKQALVEENEKLQNENDQFRQLFQENLHLFGIDSSQLQEGGEENEGQEYYEGEIIEENDQEGD